MSGTHALVTGASSGLGRHFAAVLAAAGAHVSLAARRTDALDQAVADIRGAGGRCAAVRMDVTDSGSVSSAFEAAEDRAGPVTVVINNAGVAMTKGALDIAEADWNRVVDTNLKGAWLVAQRAAQGMVARTTGGSIVNIASILGIRVAGSVAAYAASKAGVIQLTKALALELARWSVRVNALVPGYIETNLNREFFGSDAGSAIIRRIPQRRLGTLEELDGPLLLLASDASSYMTGSTLVVDGGHLVSTL